MPAIERNQTAQASFGDVLGTLFRKVGFLPFLIVILLILGCLLPNFFTFKNIMNILRQTSYLAIITTGEMLVFIVGGFDLAIGSVVALTSVVSTMVMSSEVVSNEAILMILGVLAGLGAAAVVGLVNGVTVAVFRVAPFIITLATMGMAAGLALFLSGGTPIWGVPKVMIDIFGSGSIAGVPTVFIIMVIVSIMMYLLLNQTFLGRYFWAIGGNEMAAILSGIKSKRYTVLAYVLCALFAGFTGILLTARVGSGEPVLGTGLMLQAMAAAVMGGTRVGGGEGNILGVLLGALVITLVGNVMNLANIGSYLQMIVMGGLLMFAVVLDKLVRK